MAGLMGRASTIVKAKFSKMLDRAEDPGETLDYSYEKQLELLQNVKRGIADVVTAKKRLQMQTAQLEQSVVTLDGQARQAVAADRPDLARARRWSASRPSSSSCRGSTCRSSSSRRSRRSSSRARSSSPPRSSPSARRRRSSRRSTPPPRRR